MPPGDASSIGGAEASVVFDLVFAGDRVLVDGAFAPAQVAVLDGRIARIAEPGVALRAAHRVRLADDEVLIPGLVDTHVHVNEPGRTDWEGFASATRAAAAGGVTTIVDMPLNSIPPTTSVAALAVKRARATGHVFVDVGFWGGIVPGNLGDLLPLGDEGVFGFKCFLIDSGVAEFPPVTPDEMERAMTALSRGADPAGSEAGADLDQLVIVHAEDAAAIDAAPHPHSRAYADFLASRPDAAEGAAIAAVIAAARRTGARAHILHLSSSASLEAVARARADGVRLTVETCPHYLALTAEEVPDGATAFKCCPPIRGAVNRDALWRALEEGVIDTIVSDHSPAPPAVKFAGDGDFAVAWGGIASLQLGLAVVWTEARRRGIRLERVVEWMSAAPARLVGLDGAGKGAIAPGADADLAVLAPDDAFTVDAAALHHRHPITPYAGRELVGVVRATYLAGREVDGTVARGRLLRRTRPDGGPR
ncbi:allantoinase AllB [Agromyces bracchium]|uniref:allantoinase n=1 Tax=Agromyces bracchium TaxID=88376 RepID=A0A6I3M8J0_9MICO|nr:allantoinase AllB [Agromyces bracchium]MTH69545.1 allantoinase AllB [Agromyces bracchium]